MTTTATLADDVVAFATTGTVAALDKIGDTLELLVEQCRNRARTAAAEETNLRATPFAAHMVGIDHQITHTKDSPTPYLVSVIVSIEFRAVL
jgi:hypothetical protein